MNLLDIFLQMRRSMSIVLGTSISCMCFGLAPPPALAGTEGATVVSGQVSFEQSGHNTRITASDKAIINYSSFDIALPETVQFIQPSSSASVLNRILSADPTHIDGTLLANGTVFFVNPAGIYFGAGARINVNQLVASALNISDADFLNGRYHFAGGDGSVINDGAISAEAVYLIGRQVANSGNISCPAGYVVMAAGDRVFLGEQGSDIVVEVDAPPSADSADSVDPGTGVLNEGAVEAAGGIIALAAAGDIYSQAISNVGSLSTSVETGEAGQVKLSAPGGELTNTGTIEATGGEGGQVVLEGARVGQFGTVRADGMDSHGGSVDLLASEVAALSSDSLTTANAGRNGDGGEIVIWADGTTRFYGNIQARGGAETGDGGFVEVSGHELVYRGHSDLRASRGEAGTLLLDPDTITIAGGTADGDDDEGGDSSVLLEDNSAAGEVARDADPAAFTVYESEIESTDAHIVLEADDGISTSGDFGDDQLLIMNDRDLTLRTRNDSGDLATGIDLTSSDEGAGLEIRTQGTGAITIETGVLGATTPQAAPIALSELTSGGAVTVSATGAVDADGAITAGGSVNISGSSLTVGDSITGSGVTLNGAATLDGTVDQRIDALGGTLLAGSTITKTGAGQLTLGGGTINLDGTVDVQSGALEIEDVFTAAADLQASTDVTLTGAATLDGTVDQRIDAVGGTLLAGSAITKTGAGQLTLGGGTINLDGTVDVQSGALEVEDAFTAAADLQASTDVTLTGAATLDGAVDQKIDAVGGTLLAGSTITKTGAGQLTLAGGAINLDGTVDVQSGALEVEDAFAAAADLQASTDVTLTGAATLDGAVDQQIDAVGGTLLAGSAITKTGAGQLTLGGGTINLDGTVNVQSGALEVEDAFTAAADLQASTDVTLTGAATLDGAVDQRIDAVGGTLLAGSAITKTGAGQLTLGGGTINLDGTVEVQSGALEIEDAFTAAADLQASTDVTLTGAATLDGAVDQRIDAVGGTLLAGSAITKTGAGQLTLGGGTINLDGTVDVQSGALEVEDAFAAAADLQASTDVTLTGAATLDGAVDQRIDAVGGMLVAGSAITKTGAGQLTLGGGTINLDGTVDVQSGALEVEDAFAAAADLQASTDVTLTGAATLDGAVDQRIDAVGGMLVAGSAITKTGAGQLTLGGGTINLDGTVDVQSGALEVEDAFAAAADLQASTDVTLTGAATLDGAVDQRIDAVGGMLVAGSAITKTGAGQLTLGGGTINLDGTVDVQSGALEVEDAFAAAADLQASTDVTLTGAATLDGAVDQRIDAVGGALLAGSAITKTGAGQLTLGGGTIDLNGNVDVQSGPLAIEDAFSAAGDIEAGTDVTLSDAATLDGAVDQQIDAVGGTLLAGSTITKTGAGQLTLSGGAINLDGTVDVQSGNLALEANTTVASGQVLRASGDVTLADGMTLTGTNSLTIEATNGEIRAAGTGSTIGVTGVSGSALTLRQEVDLDLANFTLANQASTDITLQSSSGSITAVDTASGGKDENAADQWQSITATARNSITLQGDGDITTDALTSLGDGDSSTSDNVSVHSTGGHLVVQDAIMAHEGGVSLITDAGRIYTPGGADDTLNVAITGYSDRTGDHDLGVDLDPEGDPDGGLGDEGKAAIVIWSKQQDLKLGPDAVLTANGFYQAYAVTTPEEKDDRASVDFRDDGGPDISGDPIDVAIYLGSVNRDVTDGTGGSVDMGSGRVNVDNAPGVGTVVIDAYDTVTFAESFENSLADPRGDNVRRLEVVSRVTNELTEAALTGTLPYALDLEALADGLFLGTYVLRGSVILDSALLDMTPPAPLIPPVALELEIGDDVEDPDTEALIALLNELGIGVRPHLAGAYAGSLSTDLRLLGAAEKLQDLICTFEDADGTRTAALRTVVAQFFPTFDSFSDAQMDAFHGKLAQHAGDGTEYDLAGQVLSALTTYVTILSTDVGWPMDKSVGFIMGRYVPQLTEGDDIRTAVIQMQLQRVAGT